MPEERTNNSMAEFQYKKVKALIRGSFKKKCNIDYNFVFEHLIYVSGNKFNSHSVRQFNS